MEYSIFCNDVKAEVERVMGPDYDVRLESVLKNNCVTYDALVIMKKGENMAPTVYLNGYFTEYNKGRNISDIALDIVVWHEMHKNEISVNISDISDYSCMKENIFVKVINAKMNEEMLKRLPHICFYDLAMVAYWILEENGQRRGFANVTNAQMELWNVEKETMFSDAIANTKEKNPPKLELLSDVMRELLAAKLKLAGYKVGEDKQLDIALAKAIEEIDSMGEQQVYVLTNARKLDGAVYMLLDDVLEQISNQLGADFYILPSSIHEVLILPREESTEYTHLEEMVSSVNERHVEPEEVLSNVVYFYEQNKGIIWDGN